MQREIAAGSLSKADVLEWSARVYGKQEFAGAGKTNTGLLVPLERRLARFVLPRIPLWLETYHLTLLTPVWSILIVVFAYFAARDLRWLWMVNLMIAFHYLTDHFDGKLGKFRDTGLRSGAFTWIICLTTRSCKSPTCAGPDRKSTRLNSSHT